MGAHHIRLKAVQYLVLATLCWAVSFPLMKSLLMLQQRLLPHSSTWFLSAVGLTFRFGVAALLLLAWHWRTLRNVTWLELYQGLGLGFFGGIGLLCQMDGLAYTSASVSAFLTQFYCVVIPVFIAVQLRRWPSVAVAFACAMVLAGVAILSDFDWQAMQLGRGEAETLLGSIIFCGQILWLERPMFARNHMGHASAIMFAMMALVCWPVSLLTQQHPGDWIKAIQAPPVLILLGLLILICTLAGYLLMNYWQPRVTATEAGLIYCAEPVFASIYVLFMPAWFAALTGVPYANEVPSWRLLIGGAMILTANVLIQLYPVQAVVPETSP
jgi:drug/metabolite transporter (DMT)-like permease